jgi:hypothetical protein
MSDVQQTASHDCVRHDVRSAAVPSAVRLVHNAAMDDGPGAARFTSRAVATDGGRAVAVTR